MSASLLRKLALGFSIGALAAAYGRPSFFVLVLALFIAVLAAVFLPRQKRVWGFVFLAVTVGGFVLQIKEERWQTAAERSLVWAKQSKNFVVAITNAPDERGFLFAKIKEPEFLRGWILTLRSQDQNFKAGEKVAVLCRSTVGRQQTNWYLARHEILSCSKTETTTISGAAVLISWRERTKEFLISRIDRLFPAPANGFFRALLLGDRTQLSPQIAESFRSTGTSHIIAISGLHFSILGIFLAALLKLFLLTPRWRFIFLAGCFFVYAWLVGFEPSVVRGTIFALVVLGVYLLGRFWLAWHTLVLLAAVFIMIDPFAVYNISFLLSFGATAGLILIAPWLIERAIWLKPAILREGLVITLGAVIATGPVLLLFTSVPLVSPLANLLVVPIVPLIMILGLMAVIFSFIAFGPAILMASILSAVLNGSVIILSHLSDLLPSIGTENNFWRAVLLLVWLAGALFLAWLGLRSIAPKPLLVYTKAEE